jgi:glycosyltransferase involved in cell wall biosynthesis
MPYSTTSDWQRFSKPAMKLLVFAQTPPPHHGQSAMVRLLLEELGRPGQAFELYHVNLRLSENSADVGRWRLGKVWPLLSACCKALAIRWRHGPMALYYVPAPAKRGALYRDWVVMTLCRPFFTKLVLHWHAVGLGHWLEHVAKPIERRISRRLLGQADLSLVLAPEVAADAEKLSPKRIAIVQNSLPETGVLPPPKHRKTGEIFEILFIGLCSEEKGFFNTLEALALLHARNPGAYRLTVAGAFDSEAAEQKFRARARDLRAAVRFVGFAEPKAKQKLFTESDVLCFPTYYQHEGQPLVLIEALAHDVPIVTTKWRAIPSMLPRKFVWFVDQRRPDQIAESIFKARQAGEPNGALREHYLLNFTPAQHVTALKTALRSLES